MQSDNVKPSEDGYAPDEVDLLLLEALVQHPDLSYKEIAKLLRVDQRTVSKRIKNLIHQDVLQKTVEINWPKLGLEAQALVGSTTARGIDYARKLNELIVADPRIVEVFETLGEYHYFMKIIDVDMNEMRDTVIRDIDVLAAELGTTLITKKLKLDYRPLIRYLRETRFPRSREREIHISRKVPSSEV
jgi:DNA-binding Lrp family transcriptional regulator